MSETVGYIRIYLSDGAFTTLPLYPTTTAWHVCVTIAKKHLVKERAQQQQLLPRTAQPPLPSYTDLDDNIHIDDTSLPSSSPTSPPTSLTEEVKTPHPSTDDFSWLHDYALFLHRLGSHRSAEDRKLADSERLIDVQEQLQVGGELDQFRFTFKQLAEINESSDEDEGGDTIALSTSSPSTLSGLSLPDPVYQQRLRRFHGHHCGYLDRRMGVNSWKQRWFVLHSSKLYCYKSHTSNPHTPLSSILITDSLISPLPLYSSLSLSSSASPFVFEISTQQKIFYLRSSTALDMNHWIEALKAGTKVERENEELDDAQRELDHLAKMDSDEDERRRMEMMQGVEGVLYDDSGCDWLCKIAMEERKHRELLAWMDIQVWFFVQRRHRHPSTTSSYSHSQALTSTGGMSGGTTGRRRRSSSTSLHTPPTVGSATPPGRGSLSLRRPSINASTLTYITSTTPPNTSVLRPRRRSSSSASHPPTPSSSSSVVPPSSFLPSLSTSLIYSRYIEPGSEMEVQLPPHLPSALRAHLLNEDGEEEEVMREIEVALREVIGRELYERWLAECMAVALMGMPVVGGTFYGHHPWKFVMRMKRKEDREEREREEEERKREEEEEVERERRKHEIKLERRRSVGRIKLQQDDEEERKQTQGEVGNRRASLTRKMSSRGLILL